MFDRTKISTSLKTFQQTYSQINLSPFVAFTTNKEIERTNNEFTLSSFDSEGRPLAIIFPWLMATPKSVQRFTDFYLSQNFDVLTLRSTTPKQLLSPKEYDKIIEAEVLPVLLSACNHQTKLIHGFSAGGYVFSRTMKQIRESEKDGDVFLNSIRAQVWDSVGDWKKVGRGAIIASFPLRIPEIIRKALITASDIYMNSFLEEETKYYQAGQQYFYNNPVKAPVLFMMSNADNLVSVPAMKECQDLWEDVGIDTEFKLSTEGEGVGHLQGLRKHPNEYKDTLIRFLNKNGFLVDVESSESFLFYEDIFGTSI